MYALVTKCVHRILDSRDFFTIKHLIHGYLKFLLSYFGHMVQLLVIFHQLTSVVQNIKCDANTANITKLGSSSITAL